jgi:hypothetical protein
MTPERKAEVEALLDDILGPEPEPQPPKPRVVVDAGAVVRDADVVVSSGDVNAKRRGGDTGVSVRRAMPPPLEPPLPPLRPGEVRVDMAAYTARRLLAEADREAERRQRREIDPFGYGHWGPRDE